MLLTDEEVLEIAEQLTWYDADVERLDPMQFARAVEAKIEAKLREHEPDQTMIECVSGAISKHISTDLYQREVIAAAQYIVHRYCNPAPIPEGWQPIETAPKDGTVIVVGFGRQTNFPVQIVFFNTLHKFWSHYGEADLGLEANATHWMPLPKPPMAAARSDRELQHEHTMKQFQEVCNGRNCYSSKARPAHSEECKADHDACYAAARKH